MGKLDGKVTIITGAAGGIGQAAARLFSEEGSKLMLVDVNEEVLADTVKTIGEDKASYTVADVTKVEAVENYLRKTLEIFGQIDVTLLNAGIEANVEKIILTSSGTLMARVAKGVWLGLKYTMKVMATNGGGSIVITSSTAGIRAHLHILLQKARFTLGQELQQVLGERIILELIQLIHPLLKPK